MGKAAPAPEIPFARTLPRESSNKAYWALAALPLLSLLSYLDNDPKQWLRLTLPFALVYAVCCICWELLYAAGKKSRKQGSSFEKLKQRITKLFSGDKNFEGLFAKKLDTIHYPFEVSLERGAEGKKIGLQLQRVKEGLQVQAIAPGSLVEERNDALKEAESALPLVKESDILVKVNEQHSPAMMPEELANLEIPKLDLVFWRKAVLNQHYRIFNVELERTKRGEPWGISLETLTELDVIRVNRVTAGSIVSLWNRRAAQRGKKDLTVYPGDWIVSCYACLGAKRICETISQAARVELTVLRWLSHSPKPQALAAASAAQAEEVSAAAAAPAVAVRADKGANKTKQPVPGPACTCCGSLCDKYILMGCTVGHVSHFRRECWRKKHGGFTIKHAPNLCHCGAPVSLLEVYEVMSPSGERRLIHKIKDGLTPIEPEQGRPRASTTSAIETARKRASSGRRAVQRVVPVAERASSPEARQERVVRVEETVPSPEARQERLATEPAHSPEARGDRPVPKAALESSSETPQGRAEPLAESAASSGAQREVREAVAAERIAPSTLPKCAKDASPYTTTIKNVQTKAPIQRIPGLPPATQHIPGLPPVPQRVQGSPPVAQHVPGLPPVTHHIPGLPPSSPKGRFRRFGAPPQSLPPAPPDVPVDNKEPMKHGDQPDKARNSNETMKGRESLNAAHTFVAKDPWADGADPWAHALRGRASTEPASCKPVDLDPWSEAAADPWSQALQNNTEPASCKQGALDPWTEAAADPWSQALQKKVALRADAAPFDPWSKADPWSQAAPAAAQKPFAIDPLSYAEFDPWAQALQTEKKKKEEEEKATLPLSALSGPPGLATPPGLCGTLGDTTRTLPPGLEKPVPPGLVQASSSSDPMPLVGAPPGLEPPSSSSVEANDFLPECWRGRDGSVVVSF